MVREVGIEPTACRLSTDCSTAELYAQFGTPNGIRTRVSGVKGQRPKPLDDGGIKSIRIWWGRMDSNQLNPKMPDLQSGAALQLCRSPTQLNSSQRSFRP